MENTVDAIIPYKDYISLVFAQKIVRHDYTANRPHARVDDLNRMVRELITDRDSLIRRVGTLEKAKIETDAKLAKYEVELEALNQFKNKTTLDIKYLNEDTTRATEDRGKLRKHCDQLQLTKEDKKPEKEDSDDELVPDEVPKSDPESDDSEKPRRGQFYAEQVVIQDPRTGKWKQGLRIYEKMPSKDVSVAPKVEKIYVYDDPSGRYVQAPKANQTFNMPYSSGAPMMMHTGMLNNGQLPVTLPNVNYSYPPNGHVAQSPVEQQFYQHVNPQNAKKLMEEKMKSELNPAWYDNILKENLRRRASGDMDSRCDDVVLFIRQLGSFTRAMKDINMAHCRCCGNRKLVGSLCECAFSLCPNCRRMVTGNSCPCKTGH